VIDGLQAGCLGFDPHKGQDILLYSIASRLSLAPTSGYAALSVGLKQPGRKAGHSPLSSAKIKTGGGKPPLTHMSSFLWCAIKHKNNFALFLPYVCVWFVKFGCVVSKEDKIKCNWFWLLICKAF
jgi:hypothetical protein